MKALVLNLKTSPDRRTYMEEVLKGLKCIKAKFVEAVDGRKLTIEEKAEKYDVGRFRKEHNREIRPGEIGCTLSHQKCYDELLISNDKSIIIFEDDVILNHDVTSLIPEVEKWLDTDAPRVMLLSGWYWHRKPENFAQGYKMATAVDALLTHAYALNRSAARLMLDNKPWYLADAWEMFRKRGVKIAGLKPHPFDQDWSGVFTTTVNNEPQQRVSTSLINKLKTKFSGLRNRILHGLCYFEHPQAVPTIKL